MEHLDICEVSDSPAGVDQTPTQLDLLVPVEEGGEVATDLLVCVTADRTGTTEEQRNLA